MTTTTLPRSSGPAGGGGAAIIFGLIACVFGWFPFLDLLAMPIALFGVAFAVIALIGSRQRMGSAISGLALSMVGLVIAVGSAVAVVGLSGMHRVTGANHAPASIPSNPPADGMPPAHPAPQSAIKPVPAVAPPSL